ncbi:MAG: hypothetical protein IJ941_05540, partial [Clostridia bacterium]|nr:hypothetical protein [Clostridia bacterium]
MPAKRGRIIRPLLLCTRAEVEQYCEKQGIDFVTDSTNLTNAYTRNKIRHNAVPVLKEINPALETAVLRMCESIRQDSDFIDGIAKAYIKENAKGNTLKLEGFSALDIAVAKRVVRIFAESVDGGIDPQAVHINELIRVIREGVRTSLPKDYYAEIQGDLL